MLFGLHKNIFKCFRFFFEKYFLFKCSKHTIVCFCLYLFCFHFCKNHALEIWKKFPNNRLPENLYIFSIILYQPQGKHTDNFIKCVWILILILFSLYLFVLLNLQVCHQVCPCEWSPRRVSSTFCIKKHCCGYSFLYSFYCSEAGRGYTENKV